MSTKPLSRRVETRIKIQTLWVELQSVRQIATNLGVSPNTVMLWKNRTTVIDQNHRRRPRKVSPMTRNMIKARMHRKLGSSTRKRAAELNRLKRYRRLHMKISHNTDQLHLKTTDWGRRAYKSPRKPLLSQKNFQDRLEFADFVEKNGYLTMVKGAPNFVEMLSLRTKVGFISTLILMHRT